MLEPLAGELNRRVTAYSVAHEPAAKSAFLDRSASAIFSLWGKVEVIGGVSYFESVNLEEKVTHRVWVRWIRGLSRPQDLKNLIELEVDGLFYRVKRVTDANNGHRFTAIECEELGDAERV